MASSEFASGSLLSSYIDDALQMLDSDDILDYFQHKDLDQNLLHNLSDSLLSIKLVMLDAEIKHYTNKDVRKWIYKVRDIVHDAEDLLDEIHTQVSISNLLEPEFQTATSLGYSFDNELQLQSRMKRILNNLESLASKKDNLGLEKSSSGGGGVGLGKRMIIMSQRLETTSLVDETSVCGRDDDKKVIIDWLMSDNCGGSNLSVISIVGMGGMGKTTLAQLVYNDKSMDDEFQLKAWVCVSEDFDVTKVTRTILEALNLPTSGREDLNTLQVKLKEKLTGKKYLLVLDDVWEEKNNKWEAVQAPLLYGARGSKILVTTRSEKVGRIMRCAYLHPLKQLSEEQSWLLFAKHALSHANSTSDFEEIGKKIIKKCDGLPLALKAIGNLLHDNSSYEEWSRILTSQMWDITDIGCDIIPALILSYQFLPSLLKRCFAYCSVIPKDYEFDKNWLIELWMAENSLQVHQQNMGMKELGDQFFNDLLSRSFFQRSTHKKELFVMHDLVNDLATYVSREFCLRSEEEQAKIITKMTRHISNLKDSKEGFVQFDSICKANKLRTFLSSSISKSISAKMVDDLLCKCKCLRALSLPFHDEYFLLPDSICNLKHLRYLDLSYNKLKKLPDSTCLLFNLHTLKLFRCMYLEELPCDMHKLRNLRHLDFRGTKVRRLPNGIGKLQKLEVLSSFFVEKCNEFNINQLGELKLRGTLSIEELQNVADPVDALAADLRNKIHLEELRLRWDSSRREVKHDGYETEEDVLEKLHPSANLKELCIEYYGGTRFPDWLGDISVNNNMVSLKLIECKHCVSLPPLGMLPSLKKLLISGLKGIRSIGAEFYGSNFSCAAAALLDVPFRSLRFLEFSRMKGWEEWNWKNASSSSSSGAGAGAGAAFPCLEELIIIECPQLKTKLPQHLPFLLKLQICWCPLLAAAYGKELLPVSSYTRLDTLKIRDYNNLEVQIQQGHPLFNSLRSLDLRDGWDTVEAVPLYLFPMLQELKLFGCRNLERLDGGGGIGGITSHSLTRLEISWCPKFVSIPQTLFFPSLTELELLHCPKLASIPPFTHFPSLTILRLAQCPEVEWPEEEEGGGGFPSTLELLHMSKCPKLLASHNKWDLHTLTSLTELTINDEVYKDVDCKEWLLPPNLKWLNGKEVVTTY